MMHVYVDGEPLEGAGSTLGTALDGLTQGFVRLTFDADSVIDNFGISGTIVKERYSGAR